MQLTELSAKDRYLAMADSEPRSGGDRLDTFRKEARDSFDRLGIPVRTDEDWRKTGLKWLDTIPFAKAESGELPGGADKFKYNGLECIRLIFVNGFFREDLSTVPELPPGVVVTSFRDAIERHAEAVGAHLGKYVSNSEQAFAALNSAMPGDGAFISVERGRVLETPVHVLHISTAPEQPTVSFPRNLVIAGENSQLTMIESYCGTDGEVYFTNAVTEISAGVNSVVDHYKIQRESDAAYHIATFQAREERGAQFAHHSVSIGGHLTRNNICTFLDGEGIHSTLNGLNITTGDQHVDNHTRIEHARPNCESHEVFKSILDGESSGVFTGMIHVWPDAQKTDAKQSSRNILLSDKASMDPQPQLRIFADDVKCTHGATIGRFDEEAIFYLRSRGISEKDAIGLLTFAFANEVISEIKVEAVRAQLERIIAERYRSDRG